MHPLTASHESESPGLGEVLSPFPEFARVIYRRNPLVEVVCQLRFPTILRIDTDAPSELQDRIRSAFPLLRERSDEVLQLPAGLPPQIASFLRAPLTQQRLEAAYDFASEDGRWTIQLTHDFVALTTTAYHHWEEFKAHFESAVRALLEIYRPAFFTRVGLRYQNLIQRSKLGLGEAPWSSLLKPQIAGLFTISDLQVREALSVASIRLPQEEGFVRIRHGLAQAVGASEDCYLIDSDFFTERRTNAEHISRTLDYFNSQSGLLFRWCIDDRLHVAMEPE